MNVMRWKFIASESGQVLLPGAISIVAMVGMVGLAIDTGNLYYAHRVLQVVADASAIAGAQQSTSCLGLSLCSTMKTAVTGVLKTTGISSTTLLTNCTAASSSGMTITINNPSCSQGAADPNHNKTGYVEAVVTQAVPTKFIRIFGISSVTVSARAEAGHTGNGNCIYALDPTGLNAIFIAPFTTLSADCGVVDESNSYSAMTCLAPTTVNVTHFNVAGSVLINTCTMSPPPPPAPPSRLPPIRWRICPRFPPSPAAPAPPRHFTDPVCPSLPMP